MDWEQSQNCTNCKQNHAADLKEFKVWKKRISEMNCTKKISYPEARKLGENFVVTTYANVAKPMNNLTKNQGITYYESINLIKEPKTLIELLRESLANLTPKPPPPPNKTQRRTPNPKLRKLNTKKQQTNQKHNSNNNKSKHSYCLYQT